MESIEYYEPKVKGYVYSGNLTTDKVWEVFTKLTGIDGDCLEQAKLHYSLNNNKLLYVDEKYGNITITDTAVNS